MEDELPKIEDEMARIASLQQSFIRTEITKEEASKHFNDQSLKLELIETAESSEGITEENVLYIAMINSKIFAWDRMYRIHLY